MLKAAVKRAEKKFKTKILGIEILSLLHISEKSSTFALALEGVAEIVLQPSMSTSYHNGIQSYAPETAGTPERGVCPFGGRGTQTGCHRPCPQFQTHPD